MQLASRLGLKVPYTRIKKIDGISLMIIERYDRIKQGSFVKRLHQEDFCQALGYSYDQKYESEGGPKILDCFSMVEANSVNPFD